MNDLIDTYQCPGCVNGPDTKTCARFNKTRNGCDNHHAGTVILGLGTVFLGMPTGFSRVGSSKENRLFIHETVEEIWPWQNKIFNIATWKHLDKNGNTLVRIHSPRINNGYIAVVRGNQLDKFPTAIEITKEHQELMD